MEMLVSIVCVYSALQRVKIYPGGESFLLSLSLFIDVIGIYSFSLCLFLCRSYFWFVSFSYSLFFSLCLYTPALMSLCIYNSLSLSLSLFLSFFLSLSLSLSLSVGGRKSSPNTKAKCKKIDQRHSMSWY